MHETLLQQLDHLVYMTPDLATTCRDLEAQLGVRATPGGQHPGKGTHNALIAIGDRAYLEIIGPDPLQSNTSPTWFGIDKLAAPKLVTWAVRKDGLEQFVNELSPKANVGAVKSGSRLTPAGSTLSWQLTDPQVVQGVGLVPFLIEWHSETHPAVGAAPGPRLVQLRVEHPDPQSISEQFDLLELELEVTRATHPALVAVFSGVSGLIELR